MSTARQSFFSKKIKSWSQRDEFNWYQRSVKQFNAINILIQLGEDSVEARPQAYLQAFDKINAAIFQLEKDFEVIKDKKLAPGSCALIGNFYFTRLLILQHYWSSWIQYSKDAANFLVTDSELFNQHRAYYKNADDIDSDQYQMYYWYQRTSPTYCEEQKLACVTLINGIEENWRYLLDLRACDRVQTISPSQPVNQGSTLPERFTALNEALFYQDIDQIEALLQDLELQHYLASDSIDLLDRLQFFDKALNLEFDFLIETLWKNDSALCNYVLNPVIDNEEFIFSWVEKILFLEQGPGLTEFAKLFLQQFSHIELLNKVNNKIIGNGAYESSRKKAIQARVSELLALEASAMDTECDKEVEAWLNQGRAFSSMFCDLFGSSGDSGDEPFSEIKVSSLAK